MYTHQQHKLQLASQMNTYIDLFTSTNVKEPLKLMNEIIRLMVEIVEINKMDFENSYEKRKDTPELIKSKLDEIEFTEEEIEFYNLKEYLK